MIPGTDTISRRFGWSRLPDGTAWTARERLLRSHLGYVPAMATVSRTMSTTPQRVWEVLADGWLCPLWVVGASRIRDVDESWPKPGSRIYHSVGVWPMLINDDTEVLEAEPQQMIKMKAKGQFLGKAEVMMTLTAAGVETEVSINEKPVSGPGTAVPDPVMAPLMNWRNTETLRRLAYLAERRPDALLKKAE